MTPETCPECRHRQTVPDGWRVYRCRGCGARNLVRSPRLRIVPDPVESRPRTRGPGAHRRRPQPLGARLSTLGQRAARYKIWSAPLVVVLVGVAMGSAGSFLSGPVGLRPAAVSVSGASPQHGGRSENDASNADAHPASTEQQPVPDVTQLKLAEAEAAMRMAGLEVEVSYVPIAGGPPGVVVRQEVTPSTLTGTLHVVHLVVSRESEPAPSPAPRPSPTRRCDPNYAGQCLNPNGTDYDCARHGENGPLYVVGEVRVVGRDHFGLDRNRDGIGCNER